MSKYFRILERAEQESLLHRHPEQSPQEGQQESPLGPQTVREVLGSESSSQVKQSRSQKLRLVPERKNEDLKTRQPNLVSLHSPTSFEAEQYRSICHGIEKMHRETGFCVIAISSPAMGDGKTVTAINLAATLAQVPGAQVLLVDLDLRRPALADYLGVDDASNHGVVDAMLDGTLSLDTVVRHLPSLNLNNLSILIAGQAPTFPHEVLQSPRLGELFAEARRSYEYIVVDTPPFLSVPDCQLLERWIDGFVLVVAAHKTPQKLVEEALGFVNPEKIAGLIMNRGDLPSRYSSYYGYGPCVDQKTGNPFAQTLRKAAGMLWPRRFSTTPSQ